MLSIKLLIVSVFSLLFAACASQPVSPADSQVGAEPKVLVNVDEHGFALLGHDPVAFFADGRPVLGDERFQSHHGGAYYRFASSANKQVFDAAPEKYAPAFGGYCGYAASIDRLSPIDVRYFQILDGRLVLQHNQRALDKWNADVKGNLVKADANWPGLVTRNGSSAKRLVNLDRMGVALMGYDPVAYFDGGAPQKGDATIEAVYDGARYWFTSQAHRETFERDPARYAPAFGGYCGYAASINKVSPVDPKIYQIIDGRLVLQHTPKAYELFNKDAKHNLARADRNWPGLVKRRGV
jgi:YHS domain-containing protein